MKLENFVARGANICPCLIGALKKINPAAAAVDAAAGGRDPLPTRVIFSSSLRDMLFCGIR